MPGDEGISYYCDQFKKEKLLTIWTKTLVVLRTFAVPSVGRHGHAEVRAGLLRARVRSRPVDGAEDLEVHGAVHLAQELGGPVARVLVGEEDGLPVPVVPVHQFLKGKTGHFQIMSVLFSSLVRLSLTL